MFVLDTNHVSELSYRTTAGLRLLQRLDASDQDAAVYAITVEETLRGWLAEIRRNTDPVHVPIQNALKSLSRLPPRMLWL